MSLKRPFRLRTAWTAARLGGRRVLGRPVGDRDTALGSLLTEQLDAMKGLPMKLGQIVSYMDVPLPEQVLSRLSALQTGSRGMGADDTRAALEAALGCPIEAAFDDFELAPFAAASIGQVHRATVAGSRVAVKLQYPGIVDTFKKDLGLVHRLASLASLASAVDGKAIVDELRRRLEEECDYGREARMQRRFAGAFTGDRDIRVPGVIDALSRPTVLTSEWADGDTFVQLQQCGDKQRIDAVAQVLVRFSYHSLLELAVIQADPHPGNFLFGPDGSVTFLDFGCVRQLDRDFLSALRDSIRAVRDHDMPRFRRALTELGVVGRPKKFDFDHFFQVMDHLYRPLLAPRFRFSSDYVRQGHAFNGPSNPNARAMSIPPAYVWVMRLQWGLWSILGKLEAEGDFRPVLDRALDAPIIPLPMADDDNRDPTVEAVA